MAQRTLYALAARTATPTAVTFGARHDSTLRLVVDVTAIAATPSIVVTVDVQDAASGKWANVLTAAAITTVSTNVLGPVHGLAGTVRVTVTHADADSITYSVGAHLSR
jgi:hypothetical protein